MIPGGLYCPIPSLNIKNSIHRQHFPLKRLLRRSCCFRQLIISQESIAHESLSTLPAATGYLLKIHVPHPPRAPSTQTSQRLTFLSDLLLLPPAALLGAASSGLPEHIPRLLPGCRRTTQNARHRTRHNANRNASGR